MNRALRYIAGGTFLFLFSLLFSSPASAQVVINEFIADGSPEWVELKNSSSSAEYLKDYWLDDDTDFDGDSGSSSKKSLNTLNTSSTVYPYFEMSSFLNNSGDSVVLFDPGGNIVDQHQYSESQGPGVPIGRSPDGTGGYAFLISATKGSANSNAQPSREPTPAPTQQSTNPPADSPTPEPSITPTASIKPTTKPSSNPRGTPVQLSGGTQDDLVLGLRDQLKPPPENKSEDEKEKKKFPAVAGAFVAGGVLFMGAAGYPFVKAKFFNRNTNEEKVS